MLTIWLESILRKLGTSTSGKSCILHNSREMTTMALYLNVVKVKKVKQSRYTPWRRLGGEEV
jgi:hypothetical protein